MIQFGNGKALLQQIPRNAFNELCTDWEMDYRIRRLSTWDMTVTHVMAQILRLPSLRDVESVLAVPRSTLSDANAHRKAEFFYDLCNIALNELRSEIGSRNTRRTLKRVFALDSTECRVHGGKATESEWACKSFLENKASARLHALWNVNDQNIEDYIVAPGRKHDMVVAQHFPIEPNATYIFDRAYNEIDFWVKIIRAKAHFVSRLKEYKSSRRDLKKARYLSKTKLGVLWDGEWKPCKQVRKAREALLKGVRFRRIIYRDPDTKRTFEFITSNFRYSAQTVADFYRKRWSVELLFRWLKQHLNIRHLLSKHTNTISIQLSIAVLIQLLLQIYKNKMKYQGTPAECLRELRSYLIVEGLRVTKRSFIVDS
jgi:hypothetical protein